jgi:2-iminobutanoate/2-iminopropanoate deaminase
VVGRNQPTSKARSLASFTSTPNPRGPIATKRVRAPSAPYSQAFAANGFVFVSGQRPVDPISGLIPDGIGAQTRQAVDNLAAILEAAGATLGDVVKVTAYLADLAMFEEFNAVYRECFQPPYPARTTVGSQLRGILVELDAIAAIP